MNGLSDNQLIYRAYLASPLWQEKRAQALAHYGCICNRCGEYGNDVHHKTYERVGGNELMEDFEVLCRECHKAHHAADGSAQKHKGRRGISRRAIFSAMSKKDRRQVVKKFKLVNDAELFTKLNHGSNMHLVNYCVLVCGCDYVFGLNRIQKREVSNPYRLAKAFKEYP